MCVFGVAVSGSPSQISMLAGLIKANLDDRLQEED
jgi:hypothetical protein